MSVLDVKSLLKAVDPEHPCGDNLEHDPAFADLEQSARGKPVRWDGKKEIPAEEPKWQEVKSKALNLLSRSKDLGAVTYLTQASVYIDGLVGLCDSLALLEGLLSQYWDDLHPQLDPSDNRDPTLRLNILVSLCDPQTMLKSIREAPLVVSRGYGQFSLRDIEIATGKIPVPAGHEGVPMSTIAAAFMDGDLDELQATARAISQSIQHAHTIESLLGERVGAEQVPDFTPLASVLKNIHRILTEHLSHRVVETVSESMSEAVDEATTSPAKPVPFSINGEIKSREDVVLILDRLCDYLNRHEPSSPVPLFLKGAKRLMSKSFIEVIRDLGPDGLAQIEKISGMTSEESKQ